MSEVVYACYEVTADVCCRHIPTKVKLFFYCVVLPLLIMLAILLALYLNPKYPEFSVEHMYVSAFNMTSSNATTNTISFDIKLRNLNKGVGLYYDGPVNVTFSFIPRDQHNNKIIIWKYSVPRFYQGNAQSRRLRDVVKPLGELEGIPVFYQTVVAEHSSVLPSFVTMASGLEPLVYFRVDFTTKVRFRLTGKDHAKDFDLSADVPIGSTTGEKFARWGVKASSGSWIGCGGTRKVLMVVLIVINLIMFV